MCKILGVAGSLREASHSRRLVQLTLDLAAEAGAEVRLLNLRERPLPLLYTPGEEHQDNLAWTRDSVDWADAFLLASPDYHGSMSGPVKNFLDHFWKEFVGKLFGYIVASHEKGLTVQDQMRTAVRQCYGWSLPYGIGFNGDAAFDHHGNLIDQGLEARVRMLAHDLNSYGGLLHAQLKADRENPEAPFSFATVGSH